MYSTSSFVLAYYGLSTSLSLLFSRLFQGFCDQGSGRWKVAIHSLVAQICYYIQVHRTYNETQYRKKRSYAICCSTINTVAFLRYFLFLYAIIESTGKFVRSSYLLTLLLFPFNICLLQPEKPALFCPVGLALISPELKRIQIPSSVNAGPQELEYFLLHELLLLKDTSASVTSSSEAVIQACLPVHK